jgi:hypothetical protein
VFTSEQRDALRRNLDSSSEYAKGADALPSGVTGELEDALVRGLHAARLSFSR